MNTIRNRAKDHMPVVLLTLLSIVQALALELLWAHISEHAYLYEATWAALLGWTQVLATMLGVLLIWLIYASIVMRFRWVPATADSIFPFLIGIVEFTLIAVLGMEHLGIWFLTMAFIFAVMTWVSHLSYRRARQDAENAEFFRVVGPAGIRDYVPTIVNVSVMVALGAFFAVTGYRDGFALIALLALIAVMLYQIYLTDRYWRLSTKPE